MPIIIDMEKDSFDELIRKAGEADDMDSRLEIIAPLSKYEYLEELVKEDDWKTRLETVERERDDYKRKYVDRFFSGIDTNNIEEVEDIIEKEKEETPTSYEELMKEE